MRDLDTKQEQEFFNLFLDFFDSEKDAGRQHDPANYSLDRMFPLADAVGNPQNSLKVIHIAGTKGKGTTSHFISALLTSCGKRTGLFTSPHLCTVRERFQIDNKLISYEKLLAAGKNIVSKIKSFGLKPSLFEIFTLLALKIFEQENVEYAVMETGIGGRLDATNFISNPLVTVITPVSFDHTALLGGTIEKIAAEKAGIIKPGVPLVLDKQPWIEAESVIRARAATLGSKVLLPSDRPISDPFLPKVYPGFLKDNFAGALAAVTALGFSPVPESFRMPQLRARFERIHDNPTVLLDGAHNGDSMQKLVANLNDIYKGTAWNVVLGSVMGKDIHGIVAALKNLENAAFFLTNPHTSKGSALEQLKQEADTQGLNVAAIIPVINSKEDLPQDKALLFTGSFFTAVIGEAIWGKQ